MCLLREGFRSALWITFCSRASQRASESRLPRTYRGRSLIVRDRPASALRSAFSLWAATRLALLSSICTSRSSERTTGARRRGEGVVDASHGCVDAGAERIVNRLPRLNQQLLERFEFLVLLVEVGAVARSISCLSSQ